MKKNRYILIFILVLFFTTGCTIQYEVDFEKDGINEVISVNDLVKSNRSKKDILNEYNRWIPAYQDILHGSGLDPSKKDPNLEYHNKKINELSNGYSYVYNFKYDVNEFELANSYRQAYPGIKVYNGGYYIVVNTEKENALCNYSYFDKAIIKLKFDDDYYQVEDINTSKKENNAYIWELSRNNCNDSEIYFKLNITKNNEIEKENTDSESDFNNIIDRYVFYIVIGLLLIIIYFGYNWFIKFKSKNDNID